MNSKVKIIWSMILIIILLTIIFFYIHSSSKKETEHSYLELIGLTKVADRIPSNARQIVIAVIDTGVDIYHQDLKEYLIPGINLIDRSKLPFDDNGHGTNVAGVISTIASYQSSHGIRIMPIKVLDKNAKGDISLLIEGIEYAINNNADIVCLSLGVNSPSQKLYDVIQLAERNKVLVISAVGNHGKGIQYPAAYSIVLSVGAMSTYKKVDRYSNKGPEIDIVAPSVVTTTEINSSKKSYRYGTSMSNAIVTGVAALILSGRPDLEPPTIKGIITEFAEDIEEPGWDYSSGFGLIRVDKVFSGIK